MGKAAAKKLQKEKALLNAAFSLFLKNGIRNTSISDITEKAGVAKGTFYLYFKDKYDIRDQIVASKAAEIFTNAFKDMKKSKILDAAVEEQVLFLLENSVDQLNANKKLMHFIATNMEWRVLSKAIVKNEDKEEVNIVEAYHNILSRVEEKYRNVEIMLFMLFELTTTACYNAAVYGSPVGLEELKPELLHTLRAIMDSFLIDGNK